MTSRLKKSQPELEPQLPIKLDSTSNGEYEPRPLTPEVQLTYGPKTRREFLNFLRLNGGIPG